MRRNLIRMISTGALLAALAAGAAGVAYASHGNGRFVGRLGIRAGGFGQPGGMLGGAFGFGPGMGAAPFGGQPFGGMGGPGMRVGGGPGGGAGILGADVLTPAASFLGVSVSTLESDLAGGKSLAQEATAKGKTAQDLINAIVANEKTILDGDKAAGWITADQETAVLTGLTSAITNLVNNGPPVPATGGTGAGPLQTAATYLGISVSDLQTDLKGGKTLADVVGTVGNGKTVDGLIAALEAPAKTNLDAAVTAGKITQAQENTLLGNLTTRLTNLVNGTKPSEAQINSVKKAIVKFATIAKFAKRH